MYEKDGQPAEKILRNMLRHRLWPGARPYKTNNLYTYLSEEGHAIASDNKKTVTASGAKHPAGKGE
jgi:hypothetical protein